jgi:hypothetical protein
MKHKDTQDTLKAVKGDDVTPAPKGADTQDPTKVKNDADAAAALKAQKIAEALGMAKVQLKALEPDGMAAALKRAGEKFHRYESMRSRKSFIFKVLALYYLRQALLLAEQAVNLRGIRKLNSGAVLLLMRIYIKAMEALKFSNGNMRMVTMKALVFRLFADLEERAEAEKSNPLPQELVLGVKNGQFPLPEIPPEDSLQRAGMALFEGRTLLLEMESYGFCNLADSGHDAFEYAEVAYRFCDKYHDDPDTPEYVREIVYRLLRSLSCKSPAINTAKCYPEMPTPKDSW